MEMLLTVEQAALRLQLRPKTIRERLKAGTLRGIKAGGGRVWRIPESALLETAPPKSQADEILAEAERLWALLTKLETHNLAIIEIADAPKAVREIINERSQAAAEIYYARPEVQAELAPWDALDGEPVIDEAGPYHTPEEGAVFRAKREARLKAKEDDS